MTHQTSLEGGSGFALFGCFLRLQDRSETGMKCENDLQVLSLFLEAHDYLDR